MIAYTFKKVIVKEDLSRVEQKLLIFLNGYEDFNKMIERFDELKGAEYVGQYYPDINPDEVPIGVVLSDEQDSKKYYKAALEEGKRLSDLLNQAFTLDKYSKLLQDYKQEGETDYSCLCRVLEEYDSLKTEPEE